MKKLNDWLWTLLVVAIALVYFAYDNGKHDALLDQCIEQTQSSSGCK